MKYRTRLARGKTPKPRGCNPWASPEQTAERARRGVSLIELLVVIALLATVTVYVGKMLHGLMLAERTSTRDLVCQRRLADASLQFREDVHGASSVTVTELGAQMECIGPANRVVTYTVVHDSLQRVSRNGDVTRPESYRLPGCEIELRAAAKPGGPCELEVSRPLPQLTYTPAAPVRSGVVLVRATPHGLGATPATREAP